MPSYIALLRAVNVGGTGKLPMTELKAMCEAAGFQKVATYIASGNVVFTSKLAEAKVKAALEKAMQAYAGKPVGVMVRTAAEMAAVLQQNPFPEAPGNRTVAIFLDEPPPRDALKAATGQAEEQMALGSPTCNGVKPVRAAHAAPSLGAACIACGLRSPVRPWKTVSAKDVAGAFMGCAARRTQLTRVAAHHHSCAELAR